MSRQRQPSLGSGQRRTWLVTEGKRQATTDASDRALESTGRGARAPVIERRISGPSWECLGCRSALDDTELNDAPRAEVPTAMPQGPQASAKRATPIPSWEIELACECRIAAACRRRRGSPGGARRARWPPRSYRCSGPPASRPARPLAGSHNRTFPPRHRRWRVSARRPRMPPSSAAVALERRDRQVGELDVIEPG